MDRLVRVGLETAADRVVGLLEEEAHEVAGLLARPAPLEADREVRALRGAEAGLRLDFALEARDERAVAGIVGRGRPPRPEGREGARGVARLVSRVAEEEVRLRVVGAEPHRLLEARPRVGGAPLPQLRVAERLPGLGPPAVAGERLRQRRLGGGEVAVGETAVTERLEGDRQRRLDYRLPGDERRRLAQAGHRALEIPGLVRLHRTPVERRGGTEVGLRHRPFRKDGPLRRAVGPGRRRLHPRRDVRGAARRLAPEGHRGPRRAGDQRRDGDPPEPSHGAQGSRPTSPAPNACGNRSASGWAIGRPSASPTTTTRSGAAPCSICRQAPHG